MHKSLNTRDGRPPACSNIYIYNTYILFSSFAYIYIYIYYIITITIHNFEDTKFTLAFSRVSLVFFALTVAVQCVCVCTCVNV